MKTKLAFSSGGVIFRKKNKKLEIALIAREKGKIWCLPKGTIEPGESLKETAVREVAEETGLQGKILDKLGQIDYWFYWKPEDTRYHKFVHFFLLKYEKGDPSSHDYEVDEVKWFSLDEALKRLSYQTEREIVEKAKKFLKESIGERGKETF